MNYNLNNVNNMFDDALIPHTLEKLTFLVSNIKIKIKENGFAISDASTEDFSTYGFCISDDYTVKRSINHLSQADSQEKFIV